ncbi:hypothetical protein SAMN02745910_01830 [Priestia endophytica DSM 13796]|uniref:Uncharacterized protein n=1 Tax=Priestia endophytica DSM 13796 TaxID=1121089 RepID=A0A1I5Z4J2_9BACI|nr:hypothetical protein SAMN02745910_01830 [Priestia endophytica DSM 13796]
MGTLIVLVHNGEKSQMIFVKQVCAFLLSGTYFMLTRMYI